MIWRKGEGGRGREDAAAAASGKWLLQPQAYPDTQKRHKGGERKDTKMRPASMIECERESERVRV